MSKFAQPLAAAALLGAMCFFAGGAALHESVTVDEPAHMAAGLSYWQRLDLRLNEEHPPLGKLLAGFGLFLHGTRADYSSPSWQVSERFFYAYGGQYVFGDAIVGRWNDWRSALVWARIPMLLLTLVLGWVIYRYGTRLGGPAGGLLCLAAYITTPAMLVFGPLVLTDLPVTLFSLIALWQLGAIWDTPSRRNAWLFGAAFAGALLSKFTGILIFAVIFTLFIHTRFWPSRGEPAGDKLSRKKWRRERWRCIWRGTAWAALLVYAVYFVFSWNQSDSALSLLGRGSWAWIVRRPLMPIWLYIRGFLMMMASGLRPTFILGHAYSHGVPWYFPVVFTLKSTLGFLALLLIAAAAAILARKRGVAVVPEHLRPHWRVLMTGFYVYLAICLLSQLDMSIRHFLIPIALLTLMLAPLPNLIAALPGRNFWRTAVAVAAASSFVSIVLAYPYLLPYVNSLAFGHPVYQLVNDSNVSWSEALPEVERFVQERHLTEIPLDWASLSDAALVVPQARPWDCQDPAASDAGHLGRSRRGVDSGEPQLRISPAIPA
jgi:hypothetical protein